MPIWYRVDSIEHLLVITAEGELTQDERLAAMRTWMNDPEYTPGLNTLFDVSACTSVPTMVQLRQVVDVMSRHSAAIGRKKLAVVATRPITFGVARQFQMLSESSPVRVHVFASREAALRWLHDKGADTAA